MLFNPTIFESRALVMQRLTDAVSHGYTHSCHGTIGIDRCAKFAKKFDLNYSVSADRNERARRKRANLGNSVLILWLKDEYINWWLLVTPPEVGDHPAHTLETLSDAAKSNERIEIDGFELVRLPKKAPKVAGTNSHNQTPRQSKQINSTLTWRMNQGKYQAWRDSIIQSVRNSNTRSMELLMYKLWSSPGFSGIRTQVGKLASLYRGEVKRSGRKDAPALPKRLGYIRRLSNRGITLSSLIAQTHRTRAMTKALSEQSRFVAMSIDASNIPSPSTNTSERNG